MDFLTLLETAKAGKEDAILKLLDMYAPLLYKTAVINGVLNEDLLQELRITFLRCIQSFQIG